MKFKVAEHECHHAVGPLVRENVAELRLEVRARRVRQAEIDLAFIVFGKLGFLSNWI